MASRPDTAAKAAMDATVRKIVTLAWLDVLGDPVRVTDAPYSLTLTGSGDVDLDGHLFEAIEGAMVGVSSVQAKEGGSETLTLTLSGLTGVDDEVMTAIGTRSNWAGRDVRLWALVLDPDTLEVIGAPWAIYTGYMTVPRITGDRQSQTIQLDVESYLGFFTQASSRGYLSLADFDADDHSAELAIAIANGAGNRK